MCYHNSGTDNSAWTVTTIANNQANLCSEGEQMWNHKYPVQTSRI